MRLEAITKPQAPASTARKTTIAALAVLIAALTSGGAMALADRKIDRTNYSHSTISDDAGQVIDIMADQMTQIRPPERNDKFGAPTQMTIFSGNVELRGRLDTAATQVLLNGAAPPAGFAPTKLPTGSIERLEVTNYDPTNTPRVVLNIIM